MQTGLGSYHPEDPDYTGNNFQTSVDNLPSLEGNPQDGTEIDWDDFDRFLDQINAEKLGKQEDYDAAYPYHANYDTPMQYTDLPVDFTPLGKAPPNGPAREKNVLDRDFGDYFNTFDGKLPCTRLLKG